MPSSVLERLDQASWNPDVRKHVVEIADRIPGRVVRYGGDQDEESHHRRENAFDTRCTYLLREAVLAPRSGAVWFQDVNLFAQESVGSLNQVMSWGDVRHEPLQRVESLSIQSPLIPCGGAATSFYHWLLERFPAVLRAAVIVPEAHFLIANDAPTYVSESLHWAFGASVASKIVTAKRPQHVSHAVLHGLPVASGYVDPEDIRTLLECRDQARERCSPTSTPGQSSADVSPEHGSSRLVDNDAEGSTARETETSTAVYISRRFSRRSLANEERVEAALEDLGVRILFPENLSFQDQVSLFSDVDHIIGAHGAGLSHLVWAPDGATLTEIMPEDRYVPCFHSIARVKGYQYNCIQSEALDDGSYRVDIDQLETTLLRAQV
jgi:hypothetical protein